MSVLLLSMVRFMGARESAVVDILAEGMVLPSARLYSLSGR
jgi:hypothetical protein